MSIDSIESISKTPCYLANSKTRRKINLQIKRDEKTHDCDRADRQSRPCEEEVGTFFILEVISNSGNVPFLKRLLKIQKPYTYVKRTVFRLSIHYIHSNVLIWS